MRTGHHHLLVALLLPALCAVGQNPPSSNRAVLSPGLITSDQGGVPGSQHGLKQSHFAVGQQPRTVTERGWSKQIGPNGAFSVSLHNGVAMALPNSHAYSLDRPFYTGDPAQHDQEVLQYFLAAGIPREQVGGVHTMTRLSLHGQRGDTPPSPPRIDGYVSVLERKVDGIPIPDSVAWAQLDNQGHVISEGVYWPAIPASALRDARRIRDQLASTSGRVTYHAHIPAGVPAGQTVIRHSSAADQQGAFEVLASYDVLEKIQSSQLSGTQTQPGPATTIMRHFDVNGAEQRLPQERRNAEKQYPPGKKTPESIPVQ